ncbi:hypothetical protein [Jeotgalibacillus terrae]|uniref:Uncharacterized protein n=1 Tax=Jeotgalibacillus terrae TaxID=587735 RepID=A0ABW5ZN26_9BACL|nr:hypothetical protein [Jeotgalibacillus terrae]MBM7581079.1 beta-xylosidase [Jeotgalibacillus terrae]
MRKIQYDDVAYEQGYKDAMEHHKKLERLKAAALKTSPEVLAEREYNRLENRFMNEDDEGILFMNSVVESQDFDELMESLNIRLEDAESIESIVTKWVVAVSKEAFSAGYVAGHKRQQGAFK